MINLTIKKSYADLVPKHTKSDYDTLYNAIKTAGGLWYPFQVNTKGVILDGMTRFKICQELKITIREDMINELEFENELEEKKFIIESNLARRHLNDFQKCELGIPLLEIEQELAKLRKTSGKTISPNERKGEAREIVAQKIGVSRGTFERARMVIEKGDEKLKEKVRGGDMSIAYAEKSLRNTERANTPTPDMPKGQFELIYLDPPWHYDLQLTGAPPYKTMTLEEMKEEIKPPTSKDCVMFMWVTNPKLEEGLALLNYWNFTYKTKMEWVKWKNEKLQVGTGYYVKGADEMLLIAIKGSPGVPPESARPPSVVFAERTKIHSEKPKIFYEIIEKMYPARKKLEMFARNKRNGWTSWGDTLEHA